MKKKWVLIAILSGIEIALFVLLYCKGFRITYAPDLENSWDAVSAFAAWGGVIMSFAAIMVAIQIPKKIADRQDRIALLEKRFEIYDILISCRVVAKLIKSGDENEDILRDFFIAFTKKTNAAQSFNRDEADFYMINCTIKLNSAVLLFSEEIASYITKLSNKLIDLSTADVQIDGSEEYSRKKQAYVEAVENFMKNEVFRKMEAEMKMV